MPFKWSTRSIVLYNGTGSAGAATGAMEFLHLQSRMRRTETLCINDTDRRMVVALSCFCRQRCCLRPYVVAIIGFTKMTSSYDSLTYVTVVLEYCFTLRSTWRISMWLRMVTSFWWNLIGSHNMFIGSHTPSTLRGQTGLGLTRSEHTLISHLRQQYRSQSDAVSQRMSSELKNSKFVLQVRSTSQSSTTVTSGTRVASYFECPQYFYMEIKRKHFHK